jgi:hypothetical protein
MFAKLKQKRLKFVNTIFDLVMEGKDRLRQEICQLRGETNEELAELLKAKE